jgi:RNA polymerase sigma factor (sigma-70 family)
MAQQDNAKAGKPEQDFLTVGVRRTLDNMTTYVVVRMQLPESAREDIWQDLALAALRAQTKFRATGEPDAWEKYAGTVIRNAAKDLLPRFYREAGLRVEPEERKESGGDAEENGRPQEKPETADPTADVYRDVSRNELNERVAALEPTLRDAARLIMDGTALSEVAGRIGVARSSLYRYVLPALREALRDFRDAF